MNEPKEDGCYWARGKGAAHDSGNKVVVKLGRIVLIPGAIRECSVSDISHWSLRCDPTQEDRDLVLSFGYKIPEWM